MKMFEIRKIKKDKWLIILLVGLLLVVIAMPVSDIKSDQTQDEPQIYLGVEFELCKENLQ